MGFRGSRVQIPPSRLDGQGVGAPQAAGGRVRTLGLRSHDVWGSVGALRRVVGRGAPAESGDGKELVGGPRSRFRGGPGREWSSPGRLTLPIFSSDGRGRWTPAGSLSC